MVYPIGYVKIWRELFTKPIWVESTSEQKVIFMTLIAMANFKPSQWEWQGKIHTCLAGQFKTSLNSITMACGKDISIQKVRTALSRFERMGFLTYIVANDGRFITIENWGLYQFGENNKHSNQQRANIDLTKEQQRVNIESTTREEGNKVIMDEGNNIYIECQNLSMTKDNYMALVDIYGEEAVDGKIEIAKNYVNLDKCIDLFSTLSCWLKDENKKRAGSSNKQRNYKSNQFKTNSRAYDTKQLQDMLVAKGRREDIKDKKQKSWGII